MKAVTLQTDMADTGQALSDLEAQLRAIDGQPDMAFVFYGCDHNAGQLGDWLETALHGVPVMGGSSSGGMMGAAAMGDEHSIGLMLFFDPDGDFGVGAAEKGSDPGTAAQAALEQALINADCEGLLPDLIWVYQSPGAEEAVIDALVARVGEDCPIFGGSAADNDVSGAWSQLAPGHVQSDGVVVGVFFPSGEIGFSFQGGYEPTGQKGVVENQFADDGAMSRTIAKIGGQDAAQLYNGWTDGAIAGPLAKGGSVLAETTMFPLGVEMGLVNGVQQYKLVHPETVTEDGGLTTFANLESGTEVHCMTGERDKLTTRAGRVVAQAAANLTCDAPAAALGCLLWRLPPWRSGRRCQMSTRLCPTPCLCRRRFWALLPLESRGCWLTETCMQTS